MRMQESPPVETRSSRPAAIWRYARWAIFYFGFMLSPLALWNDAILNQLPSAVTAAFLTRHHAAAGFSYGTLYILCYIASNVLGFLLMLVNYPLLRDRWHKLVELRRTDTRRFIRIAIVDAAAFVGLYFLGRFLVALT
jgi:hypothetical protein